MKISDMYGNFISYTVRKEDGKDTVHVDNISVNPALVNQGCGSSLINALLRVHCDDKIIINVDFDKLKEQYGDKNDLEQQILKIFHIAHKFDFKVLYAKEEMLDEMMYQLKNTEIKRIVKIILHDFTMEDSEFWMKIISGDVW